MTVDPHSLANRIKVVIKSGGVYLFFSLINRAIAQNSR